MRTVHHRLDLRHRRRQRIVGLGKRPYVVDAVSAEEFEAAGVERDEHLFVAVAEAVRAAADHHTNDRELPSLNADLHPGQPHIVVESQCLRNITAEDGAAPPAGVVGGPTSLTVFSDYGRTTVGHTRLELRRLGGADVSGRNEADGVSRDVRAGI